MSLILEALKKSEAERRLGHAPGLMTPMPATRRRQRRGPMLGFAIAVAALVAAASVWWLTRVAPNDEESVATVPSIPAVSPRPTSMPAAGVVTARDGALIAAAPVAATPSLDTTRLPRDPAFDSVERESIAVPPKTIPSPLPASDPAIPAPVAVAALASGEGPRAAAAPDALAAEDLPRLDQLPASEREALPALKLSMHVYTDSPASRFVLIDGRRYGEGEKLAPSLQLVEIRRNGTVLDFNGRRFLLQRP